MSDMVEHSQGRWQVLGDKDKGDPFMFEISGHQDSDRQKILSRA